MCLWTSRRDFMWNTFNQKGSESDDKNKTFYN